MGPDHRMAGKRLTALLTGALLCASTLAGQADVLKAEIFREADGTFRIATTVRHADAGWNHYADGWEVIDPRGNVLAHRKLWHPHVDEQPFTRSLSGIRIQATDTWVKIRAHDSVHGLGGREVTLSVPH